MGSTRPPLSVANLGLLLPLVVLAAACGADDDPGTGWEFHEDGGAIPPAGGGGGPAADACSFGTRCSGASFERCVAGRWAPERTCDAGLVCHPDGGCIEPDECTLASIERSNVGCEYYAVDLPQPRVSSWPFNVGNPWRAQFGIVVSNPWPEWVTARVERNDAEAGQAPVVAPETEVMIAPNSLEVIPLPPREVSGVTDDLGPPSRSRISNAAWRLTTSLPTVAYQFNPLHNEGVFSNDASLLVPVHSLDESYLVLGWPGEGNAAPAGVPADNRSFVTVVAAVENTRVRVVPSTDVMAGDGVPALARGQELETVLGQFGVLNLQGADVAVAGPTDFTGTRVEADHPVLVFSGVEAITVSPPNAGFCCADHLEEQMIPRSALGGQYVVVRSRPRSPDEPEPDYFKILALEDGTVVRTSLRGTDAEMTLQRGEHRLVLSAESFVVDASAPVMIGQVLLSGDAAKRVEGDPFSGEQTELHPQVGDPSFMLVPPLAQHRSEYRFLVPLDYEQSWALVAAPEGTTVRVDGTIASCTRTTVGQLASQTYEALHCRLAPGPHHLEADQPVGLVVEGWGPSVVSYGYTGGMDFEPINSECSEDTHCPGGEFCSGGYCAPEIDFI